MAEVFVASLRGDWARVVKAVQMVFGDTGFILLAEDAKAIRSLHFRRAKSLDDVCHPRGRAFDNQREVRWRENTSGHFLVTYLSEDLVPSEETGFVLSSDRWATRRASQKLYGKWNEQDNVKDWIEVSVPGISRKYQSVVDTSPPPYSLQINAVDYIQNGLVQMTRFCEVNGYREP